MTSLVSYQLIFGHLARSGDFNSKVIILFSFVLTILGERQYRKGSSSTDSRIYKNDMERIVADLLLKQHRSSTAKNYLSIWRQFNKFIISLDIKPVL